MEGITTNQHPYYLINLNESGEFIHSHPEKVITNEINLVVVHNSNGVRSQNQD
jgi:hypothetical protein